MTPLWKNEDACNITLFAVTGEALIQPSQGRPGPETLLYGGNVAPSIPRNNHDNAETIVSPQNEMASGDKMKD